MSVNQMAATRCPPPASLRKACELFEQFHCYPAWRLAKLACKREIPRLLVRVGELRGLIYRSDRGQQGCPRTFVHFLESPAELACDARGGQLYILGGNYRVTPRGIEG
jgi:hypothetical protein